MKTKDMKKISSVFVVLFFLGITAFAQTENCSDGIDNDGDGKIDCADGECVFSATIERGCNCDDGVDNDGDGNADALDSECASFYGLTFLGNNDTDCAVAGPGGGIGTFDFTTPVETGQNTVDTQSKIVVGDVDCDGIPDVVTTSKWNKTVRVMATSDGQADGSDKGDIKADWSTQGSGIFPKGDGNQFRIEHEVLIADIDGQCPAEIFVIASRIKDSGSAPTEYFLVGLRYAENKLEPLWDAVSLGSELPGMTTITDMDCDGTPEILIKDKVYDTTDGALLADGNLGDWRDVNSAPVAVDIIPGGNLEVISGNLILSYPSMAVVADMNALGFDQWFPKELFDPNEYGFTNLSSTSVADMNGDGNLDVVLSGALDSNDGATAVFFWDVTNGTVSSFLPPDDTYPDGWPWGTSRPNLGDIDGDGQLEITFTAGNKIYALEVDAGGNLVQKWVRTINDSLSGLISTTVYDFDNDGSPEVVYRDSQQLTVIDGETGQLTLWAVPCNSHTFTEGPVIADVNGDGATDICVPCYFSTSFDITSPIQQQALGELKCFYSENNSWVPTRGIWNQSGYFGSNIGDDLSVPCPRLSMVTTFSDGSCANGVPGPQRPLNTFMNQIPLLGVNGCPVYPGPDIAFVGTDPTLLPTDSGYVDPLSPSYFPAVEVIPPTCGDLDILVNFNIINDGLRSITSDMGVSFWDGDPTLDPQPATPATLLHTETLALNAFGIGDTLSFTNITVQSTGKAFTLYILLNDDGTNPLPVTIGGGIDECKIGNNVYAFPITPEPFELQIGYITDNVKCEDTAPDNGEIRAVVYEGGVEAPDYSKYSFQWYIGLDTLTPMTGPGATLSWPTGLADGAYTVVATNIAKGCKSLPIDTTIVRIGQDPIINFTTTPQTQCSPVNGQLEVAITGGNTGFTFSWRDGSLNDLGISSAIASDLAEGEYFVTVTKDGCSKTSSASVAGPTIPRVEPELTAGVFSCADPNTGAITAYALDAGGNRLADDSGYTYDWYYFDIVTNTIGSLLSGVHGTGKSRTVLPVGFYAVTTTFGVTQCESSVQIIEVPSQTKIPAVTLTQVAEQTSCDPNTPNGIITVAINYAGVPQLLSDFTIEWFKGDNVLPENKITTTSGTNGEFGESIVAGGIPYTVMVTSAFGCSITGTITIGETLIYPVVTLTPVNNTICDPALASAIDYDGSMTASVTYDGVAVTDFTDYVFTWYDGSDIIIDPIIVGETGNILSGIDAGDYTVIATYLPKSCASTQVTNTVFNVFDLPVIDIFNVVPETTCFGAATPNGSVSANVLLGGIPTTTGYTFEWYSGTDVTIPGNLIATTSGTKNETAFELGGGITYTVKIVNEATGCINTQSIPLLDNSINPSIALSKINNIVCDPALGYTGSVTAVLTDINGSLDLANDYTFTWYIGETATPGNEIADPDPSTPLTLEGVDGNWYTLVISNNVLGCPSVPVKILVEDNPPIINIVVTNNIPSTNCIGGAPNGELAAAVDIATVAGYTFTWYEGVGTGGIQRSITETATALQGGLQYTVHVVQDATGCDNTLIVDLLNESEIPVVTMTTTENIGCATGLFTGTATPIITYKGVVVPAGVGGLDDYSFTWTGPNGYTSPDPTTVSALENGDYTLTVTNTVLNCISLPFTATVGNNPAVISIADSNTPSTNCIPDTDPNGQIIADTWVDLDGNGVRNAGVEDLPALFTYQWYTGTDTSTPIGGETNPTLSTIQGGAGRNYTIETVHLASGCTQTYTVLLNDASELPIVSFTTTENIGCAAGLFTGTATATITYKGVDVTASGDYSFAWTGPNAYASTTSPTITALENGVYNLTVTNTVLSCISLPASGTVGNNPAVIAIADSNTPSTNCIPDTDPNGQIVADTWVDLDGNGVRNVGVEDVPALFTYQWYDGTDTSTPLGGETNPTLSTIQGGVGRNYTIETVHLASGCTQTYTVLLNDASELPIVTFTTTENIGCAAGLFTGTATATITYKGVDVTASGDYSFAWTGPNLYASTIGSNITTLENGVYNLTVTNTVLSCISLPASGTVGNNPAVIAIADTNTPSTNCIPDTDPNGQIIADTWVDINGDGIRDAVVEDDPALFTYQWYTGIDTSTPIGGEVNPTLSTIQGGVGRNYTIETVHLASGCTQTYTVLLNDASELPIVTFTTTENIGCAAGLFTGTATATITYKGVDVTASGDYSFAWTGPNLYASTIGSNITTLENGVYNLTVTNTVLSCISLPASGTVGNNPAVIAIADTNTPSTNCIPDTDPNGQIIADTWVDINGDGIRDAVVEDDPALFTYQWYTGTDTSTPIGGETNPTLSTIQGGVGRNYTIETLHLASGCTQTYTVLLNDASELPIVSFTTTENIGCTVGLFTGTATATIMYKGVDVTASLDYTFAWTGPNLYTSTIGSNIATLENGVYNLTVTNTVLSCISLPATGTVGNNPAVIAIADSNTPSTNCIPDTDPNGQIIADTWVDINGDGIRDAVVEDDPALFTYQWYTGIDTSTPIGGETNPTLSTIQGGVGRNYTIETVHLASGCTQTYTVLLNDASELPIVTLVPTVNTVCDDTNPLVDYNGTVTATVMYKGVDVTASGDYSFAWTSSDGAFVSANASNIIDLNGANTYTLTATNTVLSCIALPVTTTVNNNFALTTIADTNTPSTNCIPDTDPNGQIIADTWVDLDGNGVRNVGVEDVPALFTYQWYDGTDTSTPLGGETSPTLSTIQGGVGRNYTIETLHLTSGCTQTYTVLLNDASELPIVSLVPTDNTICDDTNPLVDYNGTVTATIMYKGVDVTASGDYSYAWTSTDGGFVDPGTINLANLNGALDYTLTVTNTVLSCVALPVTTTVDNSFAPITVFFTNTKNNSCAVAGNGKILAGIDLDASGTLDVGEDLLANLTDYNFTWHEGTTTTGVLPASIPAANNIDLLVGNEFFTLEVERISTGCITTYTEWVQKVITTPVIDLTVTSFDNCTTDVLVQAQITNLADFAPDNDPLLDFTYAWYRGASVATGVLIPAPGINNIPAGQQLTALDVAKTIELPADDYTVVITHTNSSCIALEKSNKVLEPQTLFDITPTLSTAASNCGLVDGVAYVNITANGSGYVLAPPYTYTWYVGAPANTAPTRYFSYTGPGYSQTDNVTSASFFTDPVVTFGAGAVELNAADDIVGTQDVNAVLSGVVDGLYTVLVEDFNGCKEYITFQIPFAAAQQSNVIIVTPDTDCAANNSSLEVIVIPDVADVTNPVATDYDIYLFAGTNPTLPAPPAVPNPADYIETQTGLLGGNTYPTVAGSLAPGVYSIVSQGQFGARCYSVPTVITIEEWAHDPLVNIVGSVNPNTSCDLPATPDGSLTIEIKHNADEGFDPVGPPIIAAPTYTVSVLPADASILIDGAAQPSVGVTDGSNVNITGLAPKDYTITVTSSRGCFTVKTYSVPDEPVIAEVITTTTIPTTTCAIFNGSMQVTAIAQVGTGGPFNTDDFNFDWTFDANGNGVFDDGLPIYSEVGNGAGNGTLYDNTDANFAGPGIYWVEITALPAAGTGLDCPSAPYQFELLDQSVNPIFVYDVTANTACDPAFADGSFFINPDRNTPDATAPAFTGWTIDFTSVPAGSALGLGNNLVLEADVFTAIGQPSGNYVFTLTDDVTGCTFDGSLEVPDNLTPPVLDNLGFAVIDQFTCTPNGSITITGIETIVSGLPGPPVVDPVTNTDINMANYSFAWYINSVAPANLIGDNNNILDNTDGVGFIGAGIYFVVITKTAANAGEGGIGCESTPYQFEIIDQSVNPIFTYDVTANTACNPLFGDGTFYIDPDRNGAAPVFTGWTINFTTDPSGTLGAPVLLPAEADIFTASALPPGQYDFTITDDATGCPFNGSLVVPDIVLPPVLDNIGFAVLDQFTCSPNGSISILQIETVVSGLPGPPTTSPVTANDANMANYNFKWYVGSVAPANEIAGITDNILDNTDAGFVGAGIYWVEITKVAANLGEGGVGCTSAPYQFEIIDQSVDPTFTYDVTANTACNPLFGDGTFYIDPNRNGAVPVFTGWTINFTTDPSGTLAAPILLAAEADIFTASALPSGQYDFTITDDVTGCPFNGSIVVPDIVLPPVLDNVGYTVVDQFICSPDGSITISQIETIVSGLPGPPTTSPVTAIDANMANYTFKWYVGSVAPANEIAGITDNILDNTDAGFVGAGIYWVEITKVAANLGEGGVGCTSAPYQFEIIDQSVDPTFTYDVTANTACDPLFGDGTFYIDPNRNGAVPVFTGWTIDFTTVPVGSALGAGNNLVLEGDIFTATGQPSGQYDFTITDDVTGCPFNGSIVVPDIVLPPVLDNVGYTVVDQFICSPDGSITISQIETIVSGLPGPPTTSPVTAIDANMANYTFKWYVGSVAPANEIAGITDNILDNTDAGFVGAGIYWVEITKVAANLGEGGVGCTSAPYQFEIIDQSVDPTFTYDVTANTACNPLFGDGTFYIDPNRNGAVPVFTGWTINFTTDPSGTLGAPILLAAEADIFTASALPSGQYNFTITDDVTGCPFNGSLVVPDIVLPPVLDNIGYTVVDQFICSPDGSISILQIETVVSGLPGPPTTSPVTAIDVNMANYTFKWYVGSVAPANEIAGITDNILDNTDAGFVGAGIYWVEITKVAANLGEGGVGCTSAPYQFEIIDQSVDPTFTYDVTANTACDPLFGDGTFYIDPNRNGAVPVFTGWTINFTTDPSGTLGAPILLPAEADIFTASALPSGQYNFTITDDVTGCPFNGSIVVPDIVLPPVLDNVGYTVVDQFICSPDGSISILQIETVVSGLPGPPTTSPVTAIDANMANYDFTWYFDANFNGIFDDAATRTNIVGGGAPGDGDIYQLGDAGFAGAGIYWVEVTKIGANPGEGGIGCTSAPFKFEIIDQSVDPTFVYEVTANTACDPAFADASFFIDPERNGAIPAFTGWTISFTTDPSGTLGAPVLLPVEADVFTANALAPGQYDFTITDDATGCPFNGSIVVPNLILPPVLDNIGYAVVDQFICSPDGSITISQIETVVSGLPGPPSTSPVTTIDVNMANYDFTWYFDADFNGIFDDAATRTNIVGGGGTNGDIYQLGDAGFAGAGVYWVEVTKIGAIPGQGGVGCTSAPYKLEIIDQSVNPIFTYTTTASTSCDPVVADGTITFNLNRNGAVPVFTNWAIDFTSTPYALGSEPAPIDATITQAGNTLNITSLLPGSYDFTITDLATGCVNQASLVIPEYIIYPALLAADFTIVDQPFCSLSGSISVNSVETIESVTLNTVNDPVLSNYEFIWYIGADFNTATQTYTDNGGSATNGEVYDNTDPGFIGAGTYWLQLRKIAVTPGDGGLGCISAPIQFIIDDVSIAPILAFTQSSNTACNTDVNGQLTAFATTSGAPVPAGSIFTWYKGTDVTGTGVLFVDGTDGIIDQSVVGQETLTNVSPGTYSVVITDLITSCILSSSFEVLDQPEIPSLTLDNASIIHQDLCYPSGSITVNDGDITLGGLPGLVADYEFIWTINSPNSAALLDGLGNPITGPVLDATTYPSMSAGSYFVSLAPVAGIGDGCFGPPVRVEVEDLTTDPIISFSTTVNSSCDNLNPNGQISAIVQEAGGIITGDTYSYVWTYNGNPLPATTTQTDIGNISTLTDAGEGDYSVVVVNVSASGCTSSYGVTLILDRFQSEPNIITVISIDPSDCNFTGSAEVTEIQVGGILANVNNFTFEWYIGSVDPANLMLDGLGLPIQTAILNNIGPDKYFVKAKELVTKCESIAKEVNILDTNIIYPTLAISLDRPQTSCDLNNPSGQLSALAEGLFDDTNPDYTFTWYSGTDTSQPAIATGSTLTNVAEGEYTAQVYNALTNCSATAFYIIEDGRDEFKLQVSISTNPIYRCDINNGSAEARILNYPSGNFQFDWTGPNGQPAGQGSIINNLAPGQYTVVATDLDGIYCPSLVKVGVVEDERENPIITLVETNPLTNCDPASPDGQLLASVNNQIGGYTFNWYTGGVATGSIIHTGNILSSLTSGTYTVQVVDDFTQCASEVVGEVTNGQLLPPTPLAEIINGQTSCIEDNGQLLASAVDNASVYYNWYNGSTTGQLPDHSMPDYSGLGLGDYTVTVTDTKTGCESEAITLSIEDETVYPEYTFRTNPANCETSNGYIEMLFEGEASIGDVIWYDNIGELSRSTNLYDQPAGVYDVSATTFLGCETTGSIEIETEITNYNGISANGDGLNDGFEIDCITMFPNNNVKIFNRAGVKIYEADGYNNDDVIFDGIGINGIYLVGENVPDGTYFYIIDKGDGSRPKTGYLELLR